MRKYQGFMDGIASVLDIGGKYPHRLNRYRINIKKYRANIKRNSDPDTKAMQSDWIQTGLDLGEFL